jgi:hypothetical protein
MMKAATLIVGLIGVITALANIFGLMGPLSYDPVFIGFVGGGGILLIFLAFAG